MGDFLKGSGQAASGRAAGQFANIAQQQAGIQMDVGNNVRQYADTWLQQQAPIQQRWLASLAAWQQPGGGATSGGSAGGDPTMGQARGNMAGEMQQGGELMPGSETSGGPLPYSLQRARDVGLPAWQQGQLAETRGGYQEGLRQFLTTGQLGPGLARGPAAQAETAQAQAAPGVQYTPPTFNAYNTATREGTENAYAQARQQALESADVRGGQLGTQLGAIGISRAGQLAQNAQTLAALQNQYGQQNAQFGATVGVQNAAQANQVGLANAGMANQVGLANAAMANQQAQGNQAAALGQYGIGAQALQADVTGGNAFAQQQAQQQQAQNNLWTYGQVNPAQQALYGQVSSLGAQAVPSYLSQLLSSAGLLSPASAAGAAGGLYSAQSQAKQAKGANTALAGRGIGAGYNRLFPETAATTAGAGAGAEIAPLLLA